MREVGFYAFVITKYRHCLFNLSTGIIYSYCILNSIGIFMKSPFLTSLKEFMLARHYTRKTIQTNTNLHTRAISLSLGTLFSLLYRLLIDLTTLPLILLWQTVQLKQCIHKACSMSSCLFMLHLRSA